MTDTHAHTLCDLIEKLTGLYENILGRTVAKKWAIVKMDTARMNVLVEEEEVLATECRRVELLRLDATQRLSGHVAAEPAAPGTPVSELINAVASAPLRMRMQQASQRLRGVLVMLRRLVRATGEMISESLGHFDAFFQVVQQAARPQAVVYTAQGTAQVRDPGQAGSALRFIDQRA